jgi:hypothetical protein
MMIVWLQSHSRQRKLSTNGTGMVGKGIGEIVAEKYRMGVDKGLHLLV